jgi:arylsulfatase A-like enzyme
MPQVSCIHRTRFNVTRVLSLVLAILVIAPHFANAADKPNIILCMADDQGWGDVGYNGHKIIKTPILDEMAAGALRFDRFYSAAPVCSPTRGSVLTGRHPNRFSCFSWGHTLRPQEVTIAEALKTAGYATGHFGKWHLGSVRAKSPVCPGNSGFDTWFSSPNFFENSPLMSSNGKVVQAKGESSLVTVNAALDFIGKQAQNDKPVLAVVWFGSPHTPHIAGPVEKELYKQYPLRAMNYYAEITGIDSAMGMLRTGLRDLDIAENTVVWYTSDNGSRSPGSTGGLRGQKGTLYEGGIRVPTIIEWPARIKKPRRTSIPCNTVDIYPTVVELTGVTVPEQPKPLDGISLVSLIDGKMEARSKPLGFWVYPASGRPVRSSVLLKEIAEEKRTGKPSTDPMKTDANAGKLTKRYSADELPGNAALIDGDYKLHRRVAKTGKGPIAYELYDLKADPHETTNIADTATDQLRKMKSALAAWQKSVIGSLNGDDYKTK